MSGVSSTAGRSPGSVGSSELFHNYQCTNMGCHPAYGAQGTEIKKQYQVGVGSFRFPRCNDAYIPITQRTVNSMNA